MTNLTTFETLTLYGVLMAPITLGCLGMILIERRRK